MIRGKKNREAPLDSYPDHARARIIESARCFDEADMGQRANPKTQHPRHGSVEAAPSGFACRTEDQPPLATWCESFVCAGGSAFLLNVALVLTDWWFVSFFALAPFLYRIIKATSMECLRLGFLFGLSFFSIAAIDSLMVSPFSFVLKLLSGTGFFALFGWAVGCARQRWGFSPFVLVFLWIGLEMGLVKLGFVGGVLGEIGFSHPIFGSLVALFGFVTVSAIIVLFNSLLILAIVKRMKVAGLRHKIVQEDERTIHFFSIRGLFTQRIHLIPEGRAPPIEGAALI